MDYVGALIIKENTSGEIDPTLIVCCKKQDDKAVDARIIEKCGQVDERDTVTKVNIRQGNHPGDAIGREEEPVFPPEVIMHPEARSAYLVEPAAFPSHDQLSVLNHDNTRQQQAHYKKHHIAIKL